SGTRGMRPTSIAKRSVRTDPRRITAAPSRPWTSSACFPSPSDMFESVRSLRPGWIGFGWFVAVALTSVLLFVLTVLNFIEPEAPTEGMGGALSLLVGFFVAGFFVGTRVNEAPVLHGLGMGLSSGEVLSVLNRV